MMLDMIRVPIIIMAAGLIPTSLIFLIGYFRHKRAEIDLERELRKHEITHGAGAMEMRVRALEAAVQQLAATSPHLAAPPQKSQLGPGEQQPALGAGKVTDRRD
jgi:hypothetical protein